MTATPQLAHASAQAVNHRLEAGEMVDRVLNSLLLLGAGVLIGFALDRWLEADRRAEDLVRLNATWERALDAESRARMAAEMRR